jgi:tRNA threonylcarbamoyladenosine biosynthesis protein TsaB
MKLLALETSTEACSVALHVDGETISKFEIAPRRHAELLLPWIGELLAQAGIAKSQLDAIACGRGPGAFTGVRLAVATVQGLALALDVPVIGVSTLQALAQPVMTRLDAEGDVSGRAGVLAAIDARMGEVYVGAFVRDGANGWIAHGAETVLPPDQFVAPASPSRWHGAGTGFSAVDSTLVKRLADALESLDAAALPHATAVAELAVAAYERGQAHAPELLQPAYLRDKVALTLVEQGKQGG